MGTKNTGEPSIEKMDDYNGKESPQKRKTINLIIITLLFIGIILVVIKYNNEMASDYVGTPQKPGINTIKGTLY